MDSRLLPKDGQTTSIITMLLKNILAVEKKWDLENIIFDIDTKICNRGILLKTEIINFTNTEFPHTIQENFLCCIPTYSAMIPAQILLRCHFEEKQIALEKYNPLCLYTS